MRSHITCWKMLSAKLAIVYIPRASIVKVMVLYHYTVLHIKNDKTNETRTYWELNLCPQSPQFLNNKYHSYMAIRLIVILKNTMYTEKRRDVWMMAEFRFLCTAIFHTSLYMYTKFHQSISYRLEDMLWTNCAQTHGCIITISASPFGRG